MWKFLTRIAERIIVTAALAMLLVLAYKAGWIPDQLVEPLVGVLVSV